MTTINCTCGGFVVLQSRLPYSGGIHSLTLPLPSLVFTKQLRRDCMADAVLHARDQVRQRFVWPVYCSVLLSGD
jgi:hypothetical protein